ncbi:MAG TPA: cytochrome c biogenesis protein ResB [Pyrinomonadaceae bacterium]|nr:cytochrome c biogenesis protein ResB [Pyrinomonadaceae bacterium]
MSAIEETKPDVSVASAVAAARPGAAPAGEGVSLVERAVTLAAGVLLVAGVKLLAGDGMSGYDLAGLLLLAGVVGALGVQKTLDTLSSVRFGVSLLILLVVFCMIGMLVMQTNVDGFESYYANLTPSQKLLYGTLNFFDIYHSRYFNFLLLVLSLNIVLASIDRFPKAWTFISKPKLDASAHWLKGQDQSASLRVEGEPAAASSRVGAAMKAVGMKARVTEKKGKTYVFGQRHAWNRLGAYAVHVALLTIFAGGFLTAQFGRNGQMSLEPGQSDNKMSELVFKIDDATGEFAPKRDDFPLPFEVTCTDIQQKLIRKEGTITADNTLDWLTRIRIKDETGEREALVHMNNPYDYRGFRFFQASFQPRGHARQITLEVTPEAGGPPSTVNVRRGGSASLADGTRVEFVDFFSDFVITQRGPDTQSDEYNRPAAMLRVTPAGGGAPERVYAMSAEMLKSAPMAGKAVGGYRFQMTDFEKASAAHVLSIQKDPGSTVVYVGFALLSATLCAVFFFAHQRVWALVEPDGDGACRVTLGGNTNRNQLGFEDRFKRLVKALGGDAPDAARGRAGETAYEVKS